MKSNVEVLVEGFVTINEYGDEKDIGTDNKNILLQKRNAVHPENMSLAIAKAMGNKENGSIYTMHFGNGGATIDPVGNITYSSPNILGNSNLNNPLYFEVVDDQDNGNIMAVRHIGGTSFSDLEIRCIIDRNEPFGQLAIDSITPSNISTDSFVFNEIGLKSEDGTLLTHVTFNPILKSSNRIIEIIYILRFSIS